MLTLETRGCRDNLRLKGDKLNDMKKLTTLNKANAELTHTSERQALLLADLSRKLQQQDTVRTPPRSL